MGSYLNPGSKGFQESLNSEIYVDKSGLIEKTNAVINTRQKFICVSRPRRFGKSMAADMLAAYYDRGEDTASLFDPLKISKTGSYQQHRNQYDVLKVNMQEFLSMTHSMDEMLTMLQKHYREVYVWLQAVEDYACLRQMDARVTQNLHLIQPNLRDYTALLASGGIDYVGTRLHGGIHAMNMGCRSLILAVDNRASEIAKDTNLPVLPRGGNLDVLEERICSAWETQIDLPTTAIRQWKNQFRETDAEKVP